MTTASPRPWLSVLFSLVSPGAGHLYTGAPWRGLAIFVLSVATVASYGVLAIQKPTGPRWAAAAAVAGVFITAGAAIDAWRGARRRSGETGRPKWSRGYVVVIAAAVANISIGQLRAWQRAHVVEAFRIPTGSMEPTLLIGDYLLIDRRPAARQALRGQLVVFRSVAEPEIRQLKRAVAVAGDTVGMRDGVVVLNGQPLMEPYVQQSAGKRQEEDREQLAKMRAWQAPVAAAGVDTTALPGLQTWGPVVVPPEHFLALGDNRDESFDSRYFGLVPTQLVEGRPLYLYWHYAAGEGGLNLARVGKWLQ